MESVAVGRAPSSGISFRIAESIAGDIRQKILGSDFADGPLPKQEDLSSEYGVSGPSIREALRILEAEGLITVRRGKLGGAYVHKPNWSSAAFALALSMQGQRVTLGDLASSLLVLEPMCVMSCAQRSDRLETVVPALRENIELHKAALGNGGKFTSVARDFHDIMVDFAENQATRLLVRSMVAVWSIQEQTWASAMQEAGRYPAEAEQQESVKAHEHMVDLVTMGAADSALSYATAHLRATQRLVLDRFEDRVVDASSPAAMRAFKSL